MKLTNETRWKTEDLRAIILAALREREVTSRGLEVVVRTATGSRGGCSGRARIGRRIAPGVFRPGDWMIVRLPTPEKARGCRGTDSSLPRWNLPLEERIALGGGEEVVRLGFARVVEHEVAHLAGMVHGSMGNNLLWCRQEVLWLGDLPLRPAEAEDRVVKKVRTQEEGIRAAEAKVQAWERRVKLANTKLAGWRRKLAARLRAADVREAAGGDV